MTDQEQTDLMNAADVAMVRLIEAINNGEAASFRPKSSYISMRVIDEKAAELRQAIAHRFGWTKRS